MSPTSLGPVKQIDAGVLNTGYVEAGQAAGWSRAASGTTCPRKRPKNSPKPSSTPAICRAQRPPKTR